VRTRAAVVAIAAALVAGCGGDERDDVDAYIRDVNTIRQELLISYTQAAATYRSFTTSPEELEKLRPKLVQAEQTVRRLDRRLAALEPPSPARQLHRLVRQVAAAQLELADELERTAGYLPAYQAALQPLDSAEEKLRRALRSATTVKAQRQAFEAFAAAVDTSLERLRALQAPAVMSGTHATQADALERLADATAELARGLRPDADRTELPRLVERFINAPLAAQSVAAQRVRIDAVKAYNERVARVRELAAAVERERVRLEQSLD
jgi:hypothetical protein